ncbi:Uncharacterised protein [Mycobacteroides abscessus subsp. abscessus]|nr:Uncharacterised protein [Mycobacteroides abscessus subsp. abscessus]
MLGAIGHDDRRDSRIRIAVEVGRSIEQLPRLMIRCPEVLELDLPRPDHLTGPVAAQVGRGVVKAVVDGQQWTRGCVVAACCGRCTCRRRCQRLRCHVTPLVRTCIYQH